MQLIYQDVNAKDKDLEVIGFTSDSTNIQTRMGAKTYLELLANGGLFTIYRPYLALNWLHNTDPYSINADGVNYSVTDAKDLGEIKIGLEGELSQNNKLWINASYVGGANGYQTYQANLGWKYNF